MMQVKKVGLEEKELVLWLDYLFEAHLAERLSHCSQEYEKVQCASLLYANQNK